MPTFQIGDQEISVDVGPGGAELTVGESKVKLDGNGNMIGAEAFGNVLEKVEGGMLITRPNGTQIQMNDDGGYTLVTPPKSVGIKDFSKVVGYTISTDVNASVHSITFSDGGYAHITYDANGKFVGISGHHLSQSINNDNEMFVGQYTQDEASA
jgi:hypothetical protein